MDVSGDIRACLEGAESNNENRLRSPLPELDCVSTRAPSPNTQDSLQTILWPESFTDKCVRPDYLRISLSDNHLETQQSVCASKTLAVRIVTWNQEGKHAPCVEDLRKHLVPYNRYHVIAIGTQECENTIAKALMDNSKAKWDAIATEAVGPDHYERVCSRVLQATYL